MFVWSQVTPSVIDSASFQSQFCLSFWYTYAPNGPKCSTQSGFCSTCGASLFFDPLDKEKHDWIGISMGAFDTPTHTTLALHIFVAEKGDYYEIMDGLPQNKHWDTGLLIII